MLERDPKRRRLTSVNAPFRSPLRRPSTPSTNPSIPSITGSSTTEPTTPSTPNPPHTTPDRPRPPRQFRSPMLTRNDEQGLTPEIIALVKRKRALEFQIKDERRLLEQAQQALKYEEKGEDEELEELILKWRRCAQKTAERVFVSARNRIDRMGGFRAFVTEQRERKATWEDGDEGMKGGEEEWEGHGREEEEEDVGDEFTMEMMLKMAGVEERLVGWDRELNNFIKK